MKILVIALSGIGDALMYTPALSLIRKHYRNSTVDALVMYKGVADIYQRTGLIDNVLYFDFLKEGIANSYTYLSALKGKYEYSINVYPSNRREYNLIQWFIGAGKRAGVDYLRQGTSNLGFLNNVRIKENDSLHNVEENILLTEKLLGFTDNEKPAMVFNIVQDDAQAAVQELTRLKIHPKDTIIGFHAGCSTLKNHTKRRWEPEKFAELGKRLIRDNNAKILLFGGPEESELKNSILERIGMPEVFIPETQNLAQSAALIKICKAFVTNDSSLMHVASSLKRNVVALIGPTNTSYIYPWQTEHTIVSLNLPCAPCFFYSPKPLTCSRTDVQYKCIKELEVEQAYQAVKKYL